jgi:molybdopterin/thiamine biosynthesis adenylyltransferase
MDTISQQLNPGLLTRGRIVQIGLGGIGQILSRYLVMFLSSLKEHEFRVVFVDGDAFEPDNGYRMDIPDFANKAEATGRALHERFGRPGLHLRWLPEYVSPKNIKRVIAEGDLVLLGVDNHATRLLASKRLRRLKDGVLISGGNDGVDPAAGQRGTYGNVQVYVRENGRDVTAPLEKFHPDIAKPADKSPAELDCIELAAAGAPQLLFANLAAASAMGNALVRLVMSPGRIGNPSHDNPSHDNSSHDNPSHGKSSHERMYDEACFDLCEAVTTPHWLLGPRN